MGKYLVKNKELRNLSAHIFAKIRKDYLSAFSAQAAFFILLSFFPFMLFMLNMTKYLPFNQTDVMNAVISIIPMDLHSYVVTIINELYSKTSGTIISFSAILLIWSASRGILAISTGLNAVYRTKESRNYFVLRFIATIYTFLMAIIIVVVLSVFVFGNTIINAIIQKYSQFENIASFIVSIRTAAGIVVLVIFFMLVYKKLPNRKGRKRDELPGALFTTTIWLGLSYLFSIFIDNFTNISYTYGSLTGIIIALMWLYICMYVMLLGAEINYFLQEGYLTHLKKVLKCRK